MTKVVGVLKKLSWGEKRRVLAEKDEMWRRDLQAWASDIAREAAAEAEARAEARDRERAYQEKLETARRLKLMGLSVEQIAAATKLSAGELESL
jgi:predicted transposase YdaD